MSVFKRQICGFCGKKYSRFFNDKCPHCDNIDFANILYCKIDSADMTYRTEERYHWKKYYYDGSFHSLAEPYEVKLENGINYTFTIVYDNHIPAEQRTYHESNFFCKRLLEKADKNPITESFDEVIEATSNIGNFRELTSQEMREYYGSCAKKMKSIVVQLHYSKQELLERLSDYYSEQEIYAAFRELDIDFKQVAVMRAKEYVDSFGGSYKSLLQTLKDFKFTPEEAIFGASNCGINWKTGALKKAKERIAANPEWSYDDLLFQMKLFDYTDEECKYAVDNCNANWNIQAVCCAKKILEQKSISKSKMIEELKTMHKFSFEQANYGAERCNADWNEQAFKVAKKFLNYNGTLSYEYCIFLLVRSGFTICEAEDAAKQLNLPPDECPERWHLNGS